MNFFQSKQYYQLMKGLPGLEPFIFDSHPSSESTGPLITGIYQSGRNKIWGKYVTRVVIIGEPNQLAECLHLLPQRNGWQFSRETHQSAIYTELRFIEPPKDTETLTKLPYTSIHRYLNILVETTEPADKLFSKVSSSKRRQIQSSLNAGASVRPASNEEEVRSFFRIIQDLYRTKVKKPLLPEEAFLRIFRDGRMGEVLLVIFRDEVVGGMLCPHVPGDVMYEWYIAGLDSRLKKYKVYPSVLVTWEAIRFASEHGFREFNFMGAGISGQPYGPRDFKLQFGGKLVEAPRLIFVHKPLLFLAGRIAIRLGFGG
jgi:serine/alanine adding enzyme